MTHDDAGAPGLEPQHDVRLLESGAYEHMAPIDVQTQQMRQRIEAVHRRLLERATDGRLTWAGEQIVRQGCGNICGQCWRTEPGDQNRRL